MHRGVLQNERAVAQRANVWVRIELMHTRAARTIFAITLLLLLAPVAASQDLTGGSLQWQSGGTMPSASVAYIDYSHPITADGTITNAAMRWLSDKTCSAAYRIRVFRRTDPSTNNFTLVGESQPGPAPAGNNFLNVFFAGIEVKKGDFVGVAQIDSTCGGATFSYSADPGDEVWQIGSGFTGGALTQAQIRRNTRLDLVVSENQSRFAGVIPVVGSIQGNGGAYFRSSLLLTNPCPAEISLKLTYHAAGTEGTSSDPALSFAIPAFGSRQFADIAREFGRTGIGTIDVHTTSCVPEASAYVYNDVGEAGTYGFNEDLVPVSAGWTENVQFAAIPIASDLTKFRVNIGVRTLDSPVTLTATVFDASGTSVGTVPSKTYPASYLLHTSLVAFLDPIAPPPGGMVQIAVQSGGPVVYYTSTIDNRTNDSSYKLIVPK